MGARMRRLFLLPVRRRLAVCAGAWLLGIRLAPFFALPRAIWMPAAGFLCALLLWRTHTARSRLLAAALWLFVLGNARMGAELSVMDAPVPPRTPFSGTVDYMRSATRVALRDVVLGDGTRLGRPVVVTLLAEEGEQPPAVAPGQRIEGKGRLFAPRGLRNPGGQDGRLRVLADGYGLSGYLVPGWRVSGARTFSLRALAREGQARLSARVDRVFGEEAPFYRALIAGDRSALEEDVSSAMRLTGIAHILAVSGLHIGLIGWMVSLLCRRLPLPKGIAMAVTLLAQGGFALLTGFSPSTSGGTFSPGAARAVCMGALRENARRIDAQYDAVTALAASALLLTMIRPAYAFGFSFVFSFYTVLGLTLAAPALTRAARHVLPLQGRMAALPDALGFCLAAQLAVAPIQLRAYGYLPLLAVPFNLVLGLLMPLLLLGGLVCLGISVLSLPAACLAASPLILISRAIADASLAASRRGALLFRLPGPYAMTLMLALAALALAGGVIVFGPARRRALFCCALLIAVSYAARFDPTTRYVQLDVGQGDAALLRSGRHATLIDTGPAGDYALLDYLRWEGLFVDDVLLSHFDEDHAGGLLRLQRSEIALGGIVSAEEGPAEEDAEKVRLAWALAAERGVPMRRVKAGDTIESGLFRLEVLSPDETLAGDNERSLVLYTEVDGMRLLLTGDLPIRAEPAAWPAADVLKVAHHGSKHSTSRAMLEEVRPALALVSVGEYNNYGHPTERVLRDLAGVGAAVCRTDRDGCVTLTPKAGRLRAATFIGRRGTDIPLRAAENDGAHVADGEEAR